MLYNKRNLVEWETGRFIDVFHSRMAHSMIPRKIYIKFVIHVLHWMELCGEGKNTHLAEISKRMAYVLHTYCFINFIMGQNNVTHLNIVICMYRHTLFVEMN